jgi:hypothetical protein
MRIVNLTDAGSAKPEGSDIPAGQLRDISLRYVDDEMTRQASDVGLAAVPPLAKRSYFNHEEVETIEAIILSSVIRYSQLMDQGHKIRLLECPSCTDPTSPTECRDLLIEKCQDLHWQLLGLQLVSA